MMIAMAKRRLLPALHMCRHTLPVQRGHLVVAEIFCWITLSVWVKILSDMDHLVFIKLKARMTFTLARARLAMQAEMSRV